MHVPSGRVRSKLGKFCLSVVVLPKVCSSQSRLRSVREHSRGPAHPPARLPRLPWTNISMPFKFCKKSSKLSVLSGNWTSTMPHFGFSANRRRCIVTFQTANTLQRFDKESRSRFNVYTPDPCQCARLRKKIRMLIAAGGVLAVILTFWLVSPHLSDSCSHRRCADVCYGFPPLSPVRRGKKWIDF